MSVDSETTVADGESIEDLGRRLGEAISDLPEYRAFEEAKRAVEEDPEAQQKIQEFEQNRQEFMQKRQAGEAGQDDLMSLQQSQNELHSMPVMAEFLSAQEEMQDRLETINEAISEPLEIDFGGEAGGCCND